MEQIKGVRLQEQNQKKRAEGKETKGQEKNQELAKKGGGEH